MPVPVSPPLGLRGGMPFESAEFTLPEGTQLVLFTDGLVEDRHRDIDAGIDKLRDALAGPARPRTKHVRRSWTPCCRLARATTSLVVVRTLLLDPSLVAEWEVPEDPSAVAGIRSGVARHLAEWGMEVLAFSTELVISELVTNSIRYGAEQRGLRVLRDGTSLICEVAEGSTSPHLRRAADTDEGGRGLFLVAQFTQRWGHPLPGPRQGDLDRPVTPRQVRRARRGHDRRTAGPVERREPVAGP